MHIQKPLTVTMGFAGLVAGIMLFHGGMPLELSGQASGGSSSSATCVGKPYPSAGCPTFSSSSSSSSVSATCGDGALDDDEECDEGIGENGKAGSACTDECTILYCGDGELSLGIGEECEPKVMLVYGEDPETGDLIIEEQWNEPQCGTHCEIPGMEKADGTLTEGCIRKVAAACPKPSSSSSSSASSKAGTGSSISSTSSAKSSVSSKATSSATSGTALCGDGKVEGDEECDTGDFNSDTQKNSCRTSCEIFYCGDGVQDRGEECDDGNTENGDGCSATCIKPTCGDGAIQPGEECDEGAKNANDGTCSLTCKTARCGDGIVQAGKEECDDGNRINIDSCSNLCKAAVCGDGTVQPGEQCDDGARNSDKEASSCRTTCKRASCGDGILDALEECDDGNRDGIDACTNECLLPRCGDGYRQEGEQCDQGAKNSDLDANACRTNCTLPSCGDSIVSEGEECDDGNKNDFDGCTSLCSKPTCGDGKMQTGEECDEGEKNNDKDPNSCRTTCRKAFCGDGIVDQGEECDGGPTCARCQKLLTAAPEETPAAVQPAGFVWDLRMMMMAGTGGITLLCFGAALFMARSQVKAKLLGIMGKTAATSATGSVAVDDVPLDQLENPWGGKLGMK
jgi:cysteine-rich repeat protein